MTYKTIRRHYVTIAIVLALLGWSVFLYFYDTQSFVEMLGAKNGYIVMFLVALFGGVSSLGAVTYIATLLTLSSGGLAPLYLALASGLGVSVGDTIYFYLGKRGLRNYFLAYEERHPKIKKILAKISVWLDRNSDIKVFFGIFTLTAFTPIPNDITAIFCGLANRPYLLAVSALVLGNMVHTYLIASFGRVFFFL